MCYSEFCITQNSGSCAVSEVSLLLEIAYTVSYPSILDSLLEEINTVTKPLDSVDVIQALDAMHQGQEPAATLPLAISEAYRLLLYMPIEYLSRSIRNDLLRRGLAADILALSQGGQDYIQSSLFFREFLRRLFVFMGTSEHLVRIFGVSRGQAELIAVP
jgi:hypothetical protein